MTYSVQQIKFECLAYIKEFGGPPPSWAIGVSDDPQRALFEINGVDESRDPWLWKPALTQAAALTVYRFMTERFHLSPAPVDGAGGKCVFLFKRATPGV
jgi:hypothetical protein